MATCPRCGEEVAPRSDTCAACGAALLPGQQLRWYLISAATLVAIIVAAALLHSYLEGRVVRSPMEFVPSSARAVVVLDLRPDSPAGRLVAGTWSLEDRKALTDRACELSQQLIDWSGLRLDVRGDVAQWFAGEALLVSIGAPQARSFTPRSLVLIARTSSLRRARVDLGRAVRDLAREGEWERKTIRSAGRTITSWGPPKGRPAIAYATADGCVLVSENSDLVELCLRAAGDRTIRLSEAKRFRDVRARVADDPLLWGYCDADDLVGAFREALPALRGGLGNLARRYLASRDSDQIPRIAGAAQGGIALAIAPERDGLRFQASYVGEGTTTGPTQAQTGPDLRSLVPADATAFGFVRDLPGLVHLATGGRLSPPMRGGRTPPARRQAPALLQTQQLPESVLAAALPRPGKSRPAMAAALAGGNAQQAGELLLKLAPTLRTADVVGARVLGSDDEAVKQVEAAASDAADRLQVKDAESAVLHAWARPAALLPELGRVDEIELVVQRRPRGGVLEVTVKAEPRYLLGGR